MASTLSPISWEAMSYTSIILGLIASQPSNYRFKEEDFESRLRRAAESEPRLQFMFKSSRGYAGDRTNALDRTLSFAQAGHILEHTGDWRCMYMPSSSRTSVVKYLQSDYGADVIKLLAPLATKVWGDSTFAQEAQH